MKTQFTPGPWKNVRFDNHGRFTIQTNEGVCVEENDYIPLFEMQANASLIAAAPDMFEALEKIDLGCNHLATGQVPWENAPILIQQFIDIARTALQKAKGGK